VVVSGLTALIAVLLLAPWKDTLFVQRNNFTGTWPNAFCFPKLDKFGLDCERVLCPNENCCQPDVFCYYDGADDGL